MDEELPNEFDLVVIGTGFSESVVAAAASRIGKTVLHLDPNEFYGGTWASFNLEAFQKFIENSSQIDVNNENSDDKNLKITENCCGISGAKQEWHIKDEDEEQQEKPKESNSINTINATTPTTPETATEAIDTTVDTSSTTPVASENNQTFSTKDKILKSFRKFNIDLIPKILYGGGKLVELLISSNICRYAEFRAIDRICTLFNGEVKNVPCSRNDVFNTNDLTIIEKRLLMKLLTSCMNYNNNSKKTGGEKKPTNTEKGEGDSENNDENAEMNFHEYEGKTFLEYLKGQKLTDKIIHCVLYAISMCNEKTSLKDGIENVKKFLNSLGRYGNTPFLFPMYGCGEIPQDFCRLCAVFGGIYCLKRSIEDLKISDDKIAEIKFNNQYIKVKNLVIGNNNIPSGLIPLFGKGGEGEEGKIQQCGGLSRAIFITSTPIGDAELNSGGGGVNIMRLPGQEEGCDGAFIIQLSHYSGTCPKGLYLIHIIAQTKSNLAEDDLKPYIEQIFKENDTKSPKILYSAFYQIPSCKKCAIKSNLLLSNVHLACGPFYEFDYDKSIENAYEIFKKLYPNDEFLPRAPDPEEIIIGDEDPTYVEGEEAAEIDEKQKNEEVECAEETTKE